MLGWIADPLSALMGGIVTLILLPVLYFFAKLIQQAIKQWGRQLFDGLVYWASRAFTHTVAANLALRRYCRLRLSDQNRWLYVPARVDIPLEIDSVFVPLTLEGTARGDYHHHNLLECGSNRLRIIGDPGSGKSTIVKRIFRDECGRSIQKPRQGRLPLLVELNKLRPPKDVSTDELGSWLLSHLRELVTAYDVYNMGECFDNYLRTTGAIILLDGLDEVSSADYARTEAAIIQCSQRLVELSDQNVVVLTMRTQFHQQVRSSFSSQFPVVLSLRRFSPTDVYQFLTLWPFETDKNVQVTRIFGDLADRPNLREMCTNPLILSMYVAEDQASGGVIAPETRTQFYSRIVEELLVRRRAKQVGRGVAITKVREQRLRVLGRMSFTHLLDTEEPANRLAWRDAVQAVKDLIGLSGDKAETYLRELSRDTGLVTEERIGETLRFVHLTFCEFLAAHYAVDQEHDGWSRLVAKHQEFLSSPDLSVRSRLAEAVPFATGLLPGHRQRAAARVLASIDDPRLLARTFLETKQYEDPSYARFVTNERTSLVAGARGEWTEDWLRELHLFTVVVRDSIQCAEQSGTPSCPIKLEDFLQEIVQRKGGMLHALLSTYAEQDAAAAFRVAELCQLDVVRDFPALVVDHCDQPPFLGLVYELAKKERGRALEWACLFAEAAIKSRVAALGLAEMPPIQDWREEVDRLPPQERWHNRGLVQRSFLTDCLSLAKNAVGSRKELEAFARIPAPGRYSVEGRMLGSDALLWLVPFGVGYFGTMIDALLLDSEVLSATFPGLAMFSGTLGYFLTIKALARKRFYHLALGLKGGTKTRVESFLSGFVGRLRFLRTASSSPEFYLYRSRGVEVLLGKEFVNCVRLAFGTAEAR